MRFIACIISLCFLFSCKNSSYTQPEVYTTSQAQQDSFRMINYENAKFLQSSRFFKRGFRDGDVSFLVSATHGELSTITISTVGLENEFQKTFTVNGRLINILFIDLDSDSNKELYLVIKNVGPPSQLSIFGVSHIEKKKVQEISVDRPEIQSPIISEKIYYDHRGLIHTFETEQSETSKRYELNIKNNTVEMTIRDLNK